MEKINYRDAVRDYLLKKLIQGTLKVTDRISLAEVARALECSVTPIREALTQLEYSFIIQAVPNRGFIIPKLESTEAVQLYKLIAELEKFAIQESFYNEQSLKKLEEKNEQFIAATKPNKNILYDSHFHKLLIKNCKNSFTVRIINDLKVRVFFYESLYMEKSDYVNESYEHHRKIIKAISLNDLNLAGELVKENWMNNLKFIKQYLDE